MAARRSTSIDLPCGSTPMPGSVVGPTFETGNGAHVVDCSSFHEAKNLHDFSTRKATAEKLSARSRLTVCLPGYAPLYLTPPTTPHRTSADVINMSRKDMETAPDVQTLPDVTCVKKFKQQKLKPTEVSEVVVAGHNVDWHNVNGHDRTAEEPRLTPRKSPTLVPQKKLHVEHAASDRFLGLLDLVKRM